MSGSRDAGMRWAVLFRHTPHGYERSFRHVVLASGMTRLWRGTFGSDAKVFVTREEADDFMETYPAQMDSWTIHHVQPRYIQTLDRWVAVL